MVCVYVNTQLVLYGQFSWFLFQIFFYQRGSGVWEDLFIFCLFLPEYSVADNVTDRSKLFRDGSFLPNPENRIEQKPN
jgi:hypothetical protein